MELKGDLAIASAVVGQLDATRRATLVANCAAIVTTTLFPTVISSSSHTIFETPIIAHETRHLVAESSVAIQLDTTAIVMTFCVG